MWGEMQKRRGVSNPGWWLQFITAAETLTNLLFLEASFISIKQAENFFFFKRYPYHFNLEDRRGLVQVVSGGREGFRGGRGEESCYLF